MKTHNLFIILAWICMIAMWTLGFMDESVFWIIFALLGLLFCLMAMVSLEIWSKKERKKINYRFIKCTRDNFVETGLMNADEFDSKIKNVNDAKNLIINRIKEIRNELNETEKIEKYW